MPFEVKRPKLPDCIREGRCWSAWFRRRCRGKQTLNREGNLLSYNKVSRVVQHDDARGSKSAPARIPLDPGVVTGCLVWPAKSTLLLLQQITKPHLLATHSFLPPLIKSRLNAPGSICLSRRLHESGVEHHYWTTFWNNTNCCYYCVTVRSDRRRPVSTLEQAFRST